METSLQLAQLVVSMLVTAALLALTARDRREPIAPYFAATLACILVWSVGNLMEVLSRSPASSSFWTDAQFFAFVPVAPFWYLTMRKIVGMPPLSRVAGALLWLPCLLILALVVVNPGGIHGAATMAGGGGDIGIRDYGLLYRYVALPYVSVVLVAAVVVLARTTRDATGARYRGALILVAATVVPLSLGLLYTLGDVPWARQDPSMSAVVLSSAACGFVLWRYRLLGLAPLASGAVIEHLADGVIVLNDNQQIVDFNPSAARIFSGLTRRAVGQGLDAVLGASAEATVRCLGPEDTPAYSPSTVDVGDPGTTVDGLGLGGLVSGGVLSVKDRGGGERHYSVATTAVRGRGGRLLGNAVVLHDVTGEIDQLERVRRLADTDDLTGFLSRRRFIELSRRELARARRHGLPVAIMVLDVDGFKAVNDRYGHLVGDRLLRAVAEVCRRQLRPHDLVGRYGGDELCVLMPQTLMDDGELVADRLREAVAEAAVSHNGARLRVTVSIGVAGVGAVTDHTLEGLLEDADAELYEAKRLGRDRISVISA